MIQEQSEVVRSLFSGLLKGIKLTSFVGTPFQTLDAKGRYVDTPLINALSVITALIIGTDFAFRAIARGFGREPLGKPKILTYDP